MAALALYLRTSIPQSETRRSLKAIAQVIMRKRAPAMTFGKPLSHGIYGETGAAAPVRRAGSAKNGRPRHGHGVGRLGTPLVGHHQVEILPARQIPELDQDGRDVMARRTRKPACRCGFLFSAPPRPARRPGGRRSCARTRGSRAGSGPGEYRRPRRPCSPESRPATASALFSRSASRAESASEARSEPV